ncbi:hypothetical protein [Pediococcus pentosaceus]|uniref:hypothetical protein n=1 Tax=Pediococcus pentosaceus TaxID=1255 RepID=UPI0018A17DF1|nr:hypothetical protein [Pediococcus pentosaceus]MBF7137246.1 hypothetical protein [Pediococcus pentosaceus]
MKIKTFWTCCTENSYFDEEVNKFIKDKHVIQISTGDTILPYDELTHTLTILYDEVEDD